MTRQDQTLLFGCLAVAFLAMLSLSAAPPASHAGQISAATAQPLQLSRLHSLTAVSVRAVSAY